MRTRCSPPRVIAAGMITLAAACLVACSPQGPAAAEAAPQVAKIARAEVTTDLSKPKAARWLLPVEVVSKVLGESLTASADLGAAEYGNTSCNYYAPGKRPGKDAPRLTVTLDWNGFNLMAMPIPEAGPATAATPYADVGNGALLDHGVLFVRAGEHSIAMDLRGKGDLHAIASRLFAAAKPKLAE